MQSINLENSLASIDETAINHCIRLNYLNIKITKHIGRYAFAFTAIQDLNVDNSTTFDSDAFAISNIESIKFNNYDNYNDYLTLKEIENKINNINTNLTLKNIYFIGPDKKEHLYDFKTKSKVY